MNLNEEGLPLVIRESVDNDSRVQLLTLLKNPFILFVISVAYRLLSDEDRQSL